MKKIVLLLPILALVGCGTVFSGSTQKITFDSNLRKNIEIYANGALVCTSTPCVVDIDRSSSAMTIMAKAEGYEDSMGQVKTKINPASWGNLLSPYSWTTDFATSSMWKYTRDGVYINMRPKRMIRADREKFERDSKIKHFALYNYGEIKSENPEYLQALSTLTDKEEKELKKIITKSNTEVELAHNLL